MIALALFAFVFASIGFASGVIASAYAPSLPLAGLDALNMIAGRVRKIEVRPHRPNSPNSAINDPPKNPPFFHATMAQGAETVEKETSHKPAILVAISNLARAFGRVLLFAVKHPVLALGLALIAIWFLAGAKLPFAWGKSKGELRLEAELARVQTELARHETDLANLATSLSERTNRVREHSRTAVQEARQEIASAVSANDFDLLYSAYERNYRRVLAYDESASGANPGAERAAPVPRLAGGPV